MTVPVLIVLVLTATIDRAPQLIRMKHRRFFSWVIGSFTPTLVFSVYPPYGRIVTLRIHVYEVSEAGECYILSRSVISSTR